MALDARTGRMLMSNSGTIGEDVFVKMVMGAFPDLTKADLLLVRDGALRPAGGPRAATPMPARNGRCVEIKGSFTDHGGYANMNREIALRLASQHGFSVKIDMLKTGVQVNPMTHALLRAMETTSLDNERCPLIAGFTPMQIQARGRRVIFYTMMETQGLHPQFVKRCNDYATEVWVPCRFYQRVFREAGVIRPVHNMPLGVNERTYMPGLPEPSLRYEEMPSGRIIGELPPAFRIVSLFGWSYRKGTDILCRSFLREFDASDDVIMVIYSRYMGSSQDVHKQHVRDEIRSYYREVDNKNPPPRIFYCGDNIPAVDLPGVYANADAFVSCSRGEGFSLPVCEAAACETPVISAYHTGMTEYLDDDVAYLVRPEEMAPANERLCWISEYYRDQSFAVMGEASIKEFGRHMRTAYSRPAETARMASALRERIMSRYTWDACAARAAERLLGGPHA